MMVNKFRIFPTLTILDGALVKTKGYKNPRYLGDPINAIKLFNNKDIDEICILDISSNYNKRNFSINSKLLEEMASEAFIPLSYGGNILSLSNAQHIISLGFEKVIVNSLFHTNFDEVTKITRELGSQSVVLKIDYCFKNDRAFYYYNGGAFNQINIEMLLRRILESQVGEIILSRIDNDGLMNGFDLEFPRQILNKLTIPLVLSHGARNKQSIEKALEKGFLNFTASSMFVFIGNLKAVLINNPLL